jgi:hypothetical protein
MIGIADLQAFPSVNKSARPIQEGDTAIIKQAFRVNGKTYKVTINRDLSQIDARTQEEVLTILANMTYAAALEKDRAPKVIDCSYNSQSDEAMVRADGIDLTDVEFMTPYLKNQLSANHEFCFRSHTKYLLTAQKSLQYVNKKLTEGTSPSKPIDDDLGDQTERILSDPSRQRRSLQSNSENSLSEAQPILEDDPSPEDLELFRNKLWSEEVGSGQAVYLNNDHSLDDPQQLQQANSENVLLERQPILEDDPSPEDLELFRNKLWSEEVGSGQAVHLNDDHSLDDSQQQANFVDERHDQEYSLVSDDVQHREVENEINALFAEQPPVPSQSIWESNILDPEEYHQNDGWFDDGLFDFPVSSEQPQQPQPLHLQLDEELGSDPESEDPELISSDQGSNSAQPTPQALRPESPSKRDDARRGPRELNEELEASLSARPSNVSVVNRAREYYEIPQDPVSKPWWLWRKQQPVQEASSHSEPHTSLENNEQVVVRRKRKTPKTVRFDLGANQYAHIDSNSTSVMCPPPPQHVTERETLLLQDDSQPSQEGLLEKFSNGVSTLWNALPSLPRRENAYRSYAADVREDEDGIYRH